MKKSRYYYQVARWMTVIGLSPLMIGIIFLLFAEMVKATKEGYGIAYIFSSSSIFIPSLLVSFIYIGAGYLYGKNIFSLRKLQSLCEKMGIKILSIRRKYIGDIFGPIPEPFGYLVKGRMNGILVNALLEKPLYTYGISYGMNVIHQILCTQKYNRWVRYFGGYESECVRHPTKPYIIMNYTSRVNLFCLLSSSSYDIDFGIKYNAAEKPNINTKCPEINQVISSFAQNIDSFHWRIIFNNNWLRLIIIGGAWQGEMFGKNIENGINCFKELVQRLAGKFPIKDLKEWDVKWDKKIWDFVLVKAEQNEVARI